VGEQYLMLNGTAKVLRTVGSSDLQFLRQTTYGWCCS